MLHGLHPNLPYRISTHIFIFIQLTAETFLFFPPKNTHALFSFVHQHFKTSILFVKWARKKNSVRQKNRKKTFYFFPYHLKEKHHEWTTLTSFHHQRTDPTWSPPNVICPLGLEISLRKDILLWDHVGRKCFLLKHQDPHKEKFSTSPFIFPQLWGIVDNEKLYKFKVYKLVTWYLYTLWNIHHNQVNIRVHYLTSLPFFFLLPFPHSSLLPLLLFFPQVGRPQIYPFSRFQVHNTMMSTTVTFRFTSFPQLSFHLA